MTRNATSLPARTEPPAAGDLDARIRAAELRIIERDEQVRSQAQQLLHRAQQTVSPQRLKVPLIGIAAVAALGVVWLVSRSRRSAQPAQAGAGHNAVASRPALPWTQLLALAWPLVPAHLRARISPATAAAVTSVALPLLGRVLGADRSSPPPATMSYVDLRRYAGRWFELARLPALFEGPCRGQPTATYLPRGRDIVVINRCADHSGRLRETRGVARVVPGSGNARLEVSLWPRPLRWLPPAWAAYWILYVDEGYDVALVGHPNRRFLWVLSRQRALPAAVMDALLRMAAERGFAVDRLQFNAP
jgi:apolipoprotein D and lipocalin family protein